MRMNCRDFVVIVSEVIDLPEPIYEFGSRQVADQGEFTNLRCFFKGKYYVGCDYVSGTGVDKIENIMSLSLKDQSVGTCLLIESLEHIENPFIALGEIYRVLKPNGVLILTTPMNFPIHDYPYDYWRFTPEGIRTLTKSFEIKIVGSQGPVDFPHTLFCVAFKSDYPAIEQLFEKLCKRLDKDMRQYQQGRFGTILNRYYTWKALISLNLREWINRNQLRFNLYK